MVNPIKGNERLVKSKNIEMGSAGNKGKSLATFNTYILNIRCKQKNPKSKVQDFNNFKYKIDIFFKCFH